MDKEQIEQIKKLAELVENPEFVISEQLDEIKDELDEIKKTIEDVELPEVINGKDGYTPQKGVDYFDGVSPDKEEIIKEILSRVPASEKVIERIETIKELPNVTEIIQTVDEAVIVERIENDLPRLGEKIRDGLELIVDEDEKLKIEAISNLRKELDDLKKLIKKNSGTVFVGGGSGGRLVKSYDLSPYLNGSSKTFTLPAFWRIISIHSTSFPFIFRETTDWTSNASNMSVTFTSEIDETTTLASGQTLTVIYSE